MSLLIVLLGWVGSRSIQGRLLRLPLRLIPRRMILPILRGPARGCHWISGSSTHGAWLGIYEAEKQAAFVRRVKPGMVVYDIGAHVGVYTLLSSILVGDAGTVVAFEPVPENVDTLRRHMVINRRNNVRIIPMALGAECRAVRFSPGDHSSTGKVTLDGALEVEQITLNEAYRRFELPLPDVIKIDVEGSEAQTLQGATMVLCQSAPVIFLSTHGESAQRDSLALLSGAGFTMELLPGDVTGEEFIARKNTCDEVKN